MKATISSTVRFSISFGVVICAARVLMSLNAALLWFARNTLGWCSVGIEFAPIHIWNRARLSFLSSDFGSNAAKWGVVMATGGEVKVNEALPGATCHFLPVLFCLSLVWLLTGCQFFPVLLCHHFDLLLLRTLHHVHFRIIFTEYTHTHTHTHTHCNIYNFGD